MGRKFNALTTLLFVAAIGLLVACGDEEDAQPTQLPAGAGQDRPTQQPAEPDDAGQAEAGLEGWLQQINAGQAPAASQDDSFHWGLGYLVHYGPIESIGLDNLIYNALVAYKQTGASGPSDAALDQDQRNLIALTEGITFDPGLDPTEQVAQTPEVRQAILARIVDSQANLSPEEALASNEVTGVVAIPSPENLGSKYLVFTQEAPGADFVFQGVVIVADAIERAAASAETYSFQGWTDLPLLGDASGPFWQALPPGVSGDPANTDEGRPGVLLLHESDYAEIAQGE
jgi:hypothetical protein